jgi:hypothetical protein
MIFARAWNVFTSSEIRAQRIFASGRISCDKRRSDNEQDVREGNDDERTG